MSLASISTTATAGTLRRDQRGIAGTAPGLARVRREIRLSWSDRAVRLALLAGLLTTVLAWASGWIEIFRRDQLCQAAVQQNKETRALLVATFEPGQELSEILKRPLSEAESARATAVQMSTTSPYLLARADGLWSTYRFSWPLAPLSTRALNAQPPRYQLSGTSSVATFQHEPFLNPVLTATGPFDVSLLIVAALPLAVIVLTYDLVSGERESGRLRMLHVQSRSIATVILTRCFIAVVILTAAIVLPVVVLTVLAWPARAADVLLPLMTLGLAVFLYGMVWGALALFVNAFGAASTPNAVFLFLCWAFWILLVPAVLEPWSASRHPASSIASLGRIEQAVSDEAEVNASDLLARYLEGRPKLALDPDDSQQQLVCQAVAVSAHVRREMRPRLHKHFESLRAREATCTRLAWFSPAIAVQAAVDQLCETSESHRSRLAADTLARQDQLAEYFELPACQNRELQRAEIDAIPAMAPAIHSWRGDRSELIGMLSALLAWSVGLATAGFAVMNKRCVAI